MAGKGNPFTRELKDPETGAWDGKEIRYRLKSVFAVVVSLAVLLGGGWFVGTKAWNAWNDFRTVEDYIGTGEKDVVVTIPRGTSLAKMADLLVKAGVIKTAKAFDREVSKNPDSNKIQAGRYKLRTKVPAKLALQMLLDPKRIVREMMQVAEGQRMSEVLKSMAKQSKIPENKFKDAVKNTKNLGLPGWAKKVKSPEGFLFPDTYELPAQRDAATVIKLSTRQFRKVTDNLDFEAKAKRLGVTPYEALIVASIIEREVYRDEDRPKVARVLYNRLKKGMKLQLDSTVAYAVGKTGTIWTTAKDRESKSPYNTYRHKGLPPGPITSPAKKSLEAAVNPAKGPWLFFVPVNLDTGETEFNETPEQHNASVAKLQAWCQASEANRKKCA